MDKEQGHVNQAMDMPAHEKTFQLFTGLVKISIAFSAIVLIGMAAFLT